MTRRLLLTGANGFVAGSIIEAARGQWEVHAASRGAAPIQRDGLVWHSFDPMDMDAFHDVFHHVDPAVVVHTAAIADIDLCESNRELATRVNYTYTHDLAELCWDHDTRFVFLSTDTVFDGERGMYTESDVPRPINFYADTKVRAEKAVQEFGGSFVVARVALVMGLPVLGAGNSFVSRMAHALREGRPVTTPANEVRTPVDVITLGRALLELAGHDYRGIVHLSGNDRLNRHEMMQRIAKRLGLPVDLVVAQDPTNIPGRAPRPRDVSLDNTKAKGVLTTPMVGLDEGLELVLATAKGNV
ncbi:MAG: NAD(P)-dependent oxidoreductase [Candidatus Hydrogenedentes bacterium]|nr:NAD(P)-dependent oxidoreductase [Candidatus Hydrogenedentota bacterium]